MKKFCVIGHPIEHSKSPQLHEAGFSEMNIAGAFKTVDIKPEDLKNWIKENKAQYTGIAVTIPHKESLFELVDRTTEAAKKVGAINTLYWDNDTLVGTNTDTMGVLKAIQTEILNISEKKVLILGAGGASRAAIFALSTAGAEVWIYNRTKEKAASLAKEFSVNFLEDLTQINPDSIDILINATSVGLKTWKTPIPEGVDLLSPHQVVFDMVYDPLETRLLAEADEVGAITISGDKMLVHQAIEQFNIWHNIELDPTIMETAFFD